MSAVQDDYEKAKAEGRLTAHSAEGMTQAFAAGDAAEGNALLERVMSRQDRRSSRDLERGNFLKVEGDPMVSDCNVIAWVTPCLAYVALEQRSLLRKDNEQMLLETVLPECLQSLDGHDLARSGGHPGDQPGAPRPRWWQCNVWFNLIAGRLMAGRALGRAEHVDKARERMTDSLHYLNTCGIAEYGTAYMGVTLRGLHWCFHYAPDETFRDQARRLLDLFYIELAEHYHPAAGVLAGTYSRFYPKNLRADTPDYGAFVKAAFGDSPLETPQKTGVSVFEAPRFLETLGLTDTYHLPERARAAAFTKEPYSVWRRSMPVNVERMMYQTSEFSMATQSGRFVWDQQDAPVVITHVAPRSSSRVALIRTPYCIVDRRAADEYARPFRRWAHQHENRAILSYGHTAGGNDLLLGLGEPAEVGLKLYDGAGRALAPPERPLELIPPQPEPPGSAVEDTVLVEFGSCYLAVIPCGLTLRVAMIGGEAQVVVPVRPTALVALVMMGRSDCKSIAEFAQRISEVTLKEVALASTRRGACLRGGGPVLTAARTGEGRLFDRRVDDVRPAFREYMAYSPFHQQRCGEDITASNGFTDRGVAHQGEYKKGRG